jgi:hypothetical protein
VARLGQTVKEPRLRIAGSNGEWVIRAQLAQLKEAWQKPLTSFSRNPQGSAGAPRSPAGRG